MVSYSILQGWPRTDVDPLTALLMLFAYEKRTGKILTDKQIQDGELRDLLQPEDFENAEKVLAFLYFLFVLIYPVLFFRCVKRPLPTVLLELLSNGRNFLQLGSPFFLLHDLRMREYVCLVDHHSTFNSSCFPLQMKDLHSERCQYTSNILRDLIAQGDEEALQVVAAAAEEGIAGTYSIRSHFDHQNVSQLKRSQECKFVPFTHHVILLAILFNSLLLSRS